MGIVIVGGGHAAGQAAASIRQEGYDAELILIGAEPHIPYQRPPLSKQYLAGEQPLDKVLLRPEKFYVDRTIDLRTGITVENIDRDGQFVACSDGSLVAYDQLLLATGSRARRPDLPGIDLGGVHTLRSIADVDKIRTDMENASHLVIIGGGYIGLEVASVAKSKEMQVTILEMEDRILQRVTHPAMSAFYHELHRAKGVNIKTNSRVTAFVGDGWVNEVVCADGTSVDADLVIVGVGVVPNVELAAEAGLACDNGIVVDERCATGDSAIFAAGDCTNHPNKLLDRRLRLESVPNAMEQSRVAASNLTGGDKKYASIPWFWSDQYDLKLQMVGFSSDADESITRGAPETHEFAMFHYRGGKIIAAEAVNSPREFLVAKQLIGKFIDPNTLSNPEVDLKSLIE
ncbi:MAG: FAD-dependent oxidoreductase [Pseudomonadales bacterium]|nr:FAD-dependent oxidoreductase [Pseudomonadales bacterium]